MKSNLITILLLLVFYQAQAWEGTDKRLNINPLKTQFTGVFVLRWPAGYCKERHQSDQINCHPEKLDLWDSTSFIIGGLWSSSKSTKPYHNFNLHYVQSDLSITDRLHNFWPKLYHENGSLSFEEDAHSLWQNQWQTSGRHFAQILEILYPEEYNWYEQQQFQEGYFRQAIALYERRFQGCQKLLKSSILHPEKEFFLQKFELANLLRIQQSSFELRCIKGTEQLYEIHICLSISEDGIFETDCKNVEKQSNMKLRSNCPHQFELLGYGKNGPNPGLRVFAYKQQQIAQQTDL